MIPKAHIERLKLRRKAYGTERRRNMAKVVLEKGTPFPKPIEYTDIDKEFERWVSNLGINFNGKRLPIFKLFANQRIGEYAQTWEHLDEVGNLLLNFICITRDNNPKHGEGQGSFYNIPGNRDYPMFIVPTLEENGEEAFEMYSMKQPFCVDFIYKVTIITNKYELLNTVNQTFLNEFKALECYISPNNHYMPMELSNVSDESEYAIDDRKYYSQTFEINLKGYIIRKEDMTVTKLPSRIFYTNTLPRKKNKPKVEINEEYEHPLNCCSDREEEIDRYANKKIKLVINFSVCDFKTEFEIDTSFNVTDIETNNVHDFVMKINNEYVDFDEEIVISDGDTIYIEIERDNIRKDATIEIYGTTDEKYDILDDSELYSDSPISEEEIIKNV